MSIGLKLSTYLNKYIYAAVADLANTYSIDLPNDVAYQSYENLELSKPVTKLKSRFTMSTEVRPILETLYKTYFTEINDIVFTDIDQVVKTIPSLDDNIIKFVYDANKSAEFKIGTLLLGAEDQGWLCAAAVKELTKYKNKDELHGYFTSMFRTFIKCIALYIGSLVVHNSLTTVKPQLIGSFMILNGISLVDYSNIFADFDPFAKKLTIVDIVKNIKLDPLPVTSAGTATVATATVDTKTSTGASVVTTTDEDLLDAINNQ